MEILNQITWQDAVTGLSVVFGLITLIAYLDQRRSNKEQSRMLEFVNRHLDKDITIEQINQLKDKKSKISIEVNDKIPTLGRIAILEDQADFYNRGLITNYQELKIINDKINLLKTQSSITEVDPEIKNYLLREISPKYKFQELKQKSRDRIISLLAIIIAVGAIFPLGLDFYIQFVFGFYLVFEVLKYLVLDSDKKSDKEKLFENAEWISQFVGFGILSIGFIMRYSRFDIETDAFINFKFFETAFIAIGIIIALASHQIVKIVRAKIEKQIKDGSH